MAKLVIFFLITFFLMASLGFNFSPAPSKTPSEEYCEVEEERVQQRGLSINSIFRLFGLFQVDFNIFELGPVSVNLSIEVEVEWCTIGTPTICVQLSINSIFRLFGSGQIDVKMFKVGTIPVTLSFEI
ncbi:hypothetical protein HanRHA438_Chr15g0699501 [Helianthus annuus]|uniref:Transmembrane protein n=2 Tax=Helianthus annuus TaxID=4232 RepID=A0A251S7Y6_HELAN|nr:hypothetical protein HanXRQr2_Chr15g0687251 [Helianthus annuus]KAJ0450761.1 hypothetical protein HanHA300_Chr15g0559891 [Helianthus annuus]KAJ0455050.1 hypothetical protein HanIR_Chr15g0746821 [Helianthus annuus]KAJ0472621.1 hypothetical protein HanHA89_Chr15g0609101 [Helianthus annuus]KAJ0648224.1 hypothetical protein HanLR1_Chr15g0570481 [Helianthus annuus]